MSYTGWVRQRRIDYYARRFQPPVWQPYYHPVLVQIALLRSAGAKYIILDDDERRN